MGEPAKAPDCGDNGEAASAWVPRVLLNNGMRMPQFGLGTWKSSREDVKAAVQTAVSQGYRMIECALEYGNEREIGLAFCEMYRDGVMTRDRLFITSKVWMTFMRKDLVEEAFRMSIKDLQTDYLDLYLIHWPTALKECQGLHPTDDTGRWMYSKADYLDTWKELERMYKEKKVKAIAVCNFNRKQLTKLIQNCKIKPVVNQVECHPYLNQAKMKAFVELQMMYLMAYSPLGSNDRPWRKATDKVVIEDTVLKQIGEAHGKTAAQVCLRYQLQRGNITMSKSVTPEHMQENFSVWDFCLTPEEMKDVDCLSQNIKYVALEWIKDHPQYPFNDEW